MELTTDMVLVLAMIALAIFLFIVEWIRVDVVAILMMVVLPLLGLVTPQEAFIGLSSNAVVSIIAVIIIGAGLDKTGAINRVLEPVMKLTGDNQSKIVIGISATISLISSFMQNIGAAALFLPAIKRISKSVKIPISRMLMPIGFCAILGGTITMVGSSPLIILNDLIEPFKLKPFGLFDVTPIGLSLVVSGIAYFVFFGKYVLPQGDLSELEKSDQSDELLTNHYDFIGNTFELFIPEDWVNIDRLRITDVRKKYLISIVLLRDSGKEIYISPDRNHILTNVCDIGVYGTKESVNKFASDYGLTVKGSLDVFKNLLSASTSGTTEVVVAPRSEFEGKTLYDLDFRKTFHIIPMAIYRGSNNIIKTDVGTEKLRVGDAILLHSSWDRLKRLEKNPNLIITTKLDKETIREDKALLAAFWLALSLTMVIGFNIHLSLSLMTGALGIILTRVLTIDEAYKSVDWRTVFLLAGLIPLGMATENTGTAAWIAEVILTSVGTVSEIMLLTIIALLTTAFTLVISNVGATVLLVPLVINLALQSGADPRMAALVVGIAASNSFILPTHQVNALYMGPGRYKSVDFIKAGAIESLIFIVVLIGVLKLLYI